MVFVETDVFTQMLKGILSDEEYSELQMDLAANPEIGDMITGTGGLRKVRWAAKGKGKRGGARAIYYYVVGANQIRMLLIYAKGAKDNLNAAEKKVLRNLNESWC